MEEIKKVVSIHHIAVQTSDIDKSIFFYTQILGAELLERKPFKSRICSWIRIGDVKIELYSKRKDEKLDPWSDYYCGPVHIAFLVDNLDIFLSQALARGAKFHPSHPEPFVPPVPGAKKIAYFLGPDGEEVEIRDGD